LLVLLLLLLLLQLSLVIETCFVHGRGPGEKKRNTNKKLGKKK